MAAATAAAFFDAVLRRLAGVPSSTSDSTSDPEGGGDIESGAVPARA